jgi:invasion protein IalB
MRAIRLHWLAAATALPGLAVAVTNFETAGAITGSGAPDVELAQAADENASLPGGATALTETHGDWTVSCAQRTDGKRCTFS